MKKVLENYGGIALFYIMVIICGFMLCSGTNEMREEKGSSFYTLQIENR